MRWRASHVLALVLMLSLALNFFQGGLLLSPLLFGGATEKQVKIGPFNREAARAALSDRYQPQIDAIWDQNRAPLRAKRHALREAHEVVLRQFLAEPFERAALDRAHEKLTARLLETRQAMEATIGEIAEALPPDERRRYFKASALRRRGPPPFGHPPPDCRKGEDCPPPKRPPPD